jgi:ribosomal protein S18 acetylase RimI-like enzyme
MVIRVARAEDARALARVMVDTWPVHQGQMPEEVWTKQRQRWTYDEARKWAQILREIADGTSPRECIYAAEDEGGEIVGLARGGPSYLNENLILAGTLPGEIVGLARDDPSYEEATEHTGEIYALYVRESHQRRGLGRRLVQAVAAHLAELGMTSLLIGCLAAGIPARRFYEALGGQVVGEREYDENGVKLPIVVYGWPDLRGLKR